MTDSDRETIKLVANAFDRASTSCLTVGLLAPLAAALYGVGTAPSVGSIAAAALLYIAAAGALHWGARLVLKGLVT